MIRYGEQKAVVIGEFELNLYQMELLGLDKTLLFRRDVDSNGRHQMKINDEVVTLNKLRETMLLLEISTNKTIQ